jgi:hypothetical protein
MNRIENYAAFYGLLNRMPAPDREELKKSIVSQYTRGRTTSLREMNAREYLSALRGMQKTVESDRPEQEQEIKRKRSAVLRQIQLYGVDTTKWSHIDAFCTDARIAGKVFRSLNVKELDALSVKLRMILRKTGKDLKI